MSRKNIIINKKLLAERIERYVFYLYINYDF